MRVLRTRQGAKRSAAVAAPNEAKRSECGNFVKLRIMLNARQCIYPVATAPFSREAHFRVFMLLLGLFTAHAAGQMIAALWPHTSFFACKLPFPGVHDHTPAVAQPLAVVLALRTVAEAGSPCATTDH